MHRCLVVSRELGLFSCQRRENFHFSHPWSIVSSTMVSSIGLNGPTIHVYLLGGYQGMEQRYLI